MRDKGKGKSEGKQIEGAAKNKVGEPVNLCGLRLTLIQHREMFAEALRLAMAPTTIFLGGALQ